LIQSADGAAALSHDEFNPEFDRLVLEVQRSLDYYDRYFSQSSVAKILIAPTAQAIPNLAEYISRNTGINASIFDVNEILDVSEPVDDYHQASCILAIGAAMRQERKTL
jgi:MSHA biogenesis protein MshI